MQEFYQKTAWENEPSTNSAINDENLNNIEDGIGELDSRVVRLDNTKSNVDWVQLQTDGKKIAEVTIDGVKKNVYVPRGTGGSGGASSWEDLEEKPFETLDNNNFNVSDGILSIKDKASGVEVSAIKESLIQFKDDGFLPKNLFNPSNVLNANISTEPSITSSDRTRLVYAKCEPNKTYTVSKMVGARFQVAYTKALPSVGVNFFGKVTQNSASSITITTGADAEYIVAFVYSSSSGDSMSAETMIASVQIEEGTEAHSYTPYAMSNTGLTQITEELKQRIAQITEEKTYPLNANGVSIVWSSCLVRNGICFLNAEINVSSGIAEGATILTGMPKSREWSNFPIMNGNDYTLTFGYVRRDVSEIRTRNALPSGRYILNATYLV